MACGATHLLLDNLTPAQAKEWIAHINGRAQVELSEGITLENARAYAETGANYISSGARLRTQLGRWTSIFGWNFSNAPRPKAHPPA